MDTPSFKPKSWKQLTHQARAAPVPADIDVRAAIHAQITSSQIRASQAASLFDDVISLFQSRWLRTSFACLTVAALLACLESFHVVDELAWIWQLQGPVLADI